MRAVCDLILGVVYLTLGVVCLPLTLLLKVVSLRIPWFHDAFELLAALPWAGLSMIFAAWPSRRK